MLLVRIQSLSPITKDAMNAVGRCVMKDAKKLEYVPEDGPNQAAVKMATGTARKKARKNLFCVMNLVRNHQPMIIIPKNR